MRRTLLAPALAAALLTAAPAGAQSFAPGDSILQRIWTEASFA